LPKERDTVDFICVGAQKSGTTWLNERFKELPEISVPPIKEIHYFDRDEKYSSPNIHAHKNLFLKLVNYSWLRGFWRRLLRPTLKGEFKQFNWKLRYYFQPPTDDWYESLFQDFDGITGEITPSYSIISERDIRRIKQLHPTVKIIILLRDPIERAWSHFKYINKESDYGNIKKIKKFIHSSRQEERSNYKKILSKYHKYFPNEQLYVSYFDRIIIEPEKLLSEIVNFLGGNQENIKKYCHLKNKSNSSKGEEMPREVYQLLKEKYFLSIKELSERYGSYCEKWYKRHYKES